MKDRLGKDRISKFLPFVKGGKEGFEGVMQIRDIVGKEKSPLSPLYKRGGPDDNVLCQVFSWIRLALKFWSSLVKIMPVPIICQIDLSD